MFVHDNEFSIWDVAPRDCGFIMGDMETIPIPVPRMVFNHNVHKHCPKNFVINKSFHNNNSQNPYMNY